MSGPFFLTPCSADGSPRRLGIELEFAGVTLEDAAALVAETWGGTVERTGKYRYHVATPHGGVGIELDVQWMHRLSAHHDRDRLPDEEGHSLADAADALLRPLVDWVGPSEIVLPPVEPGQMSLVETLIDRLRHRGAQGTGARLLNAFGLHANIDVPSFEAASILAYLQAFILLQEWLVDALDMDMTRRLSRFARLFPEDYGRKVLARNYRPSRDLLIDDYLAGNPTRNHALDFLPLFAFLDGKRVRAALDDTLVKPRPVFHFRMPNCRVDEMGWTATSEIASWTEVERLAENDGLRREMADAYLANLSRLRHPFDRMWQNETSQWLKKKQG